MKKKKIILPQLNDAGGDLSKQWFIYYSVLDPGSGNLKRFKTYKGFDTLKTADQRYAHAEQVMSDLRKKLEIGWSPFKKQETIIFQDEVMYYHQAELSGRNKITLNNIRPLHSEFLADQKIKVAPKTYESYQSKTRLFVQWLETNYHDLKVEQIDNAVIKNFFLYLITVKQRSRPTVEKYQQNLTRLFDYFIFKGVIKENPIHSIPRTGLIVDYAPKPIKSEDAKKLKKLISKEDPQLWLACQFQYYCFIRPGTELRLLKIFNIDFEAAQIRVVNTLAKNRREEIVQIPDLFLTILLDRYQLDQYPDDYFVFGRDGCPGTETLGKNTLRVRFNKFRDQLKLSKEYKFYSWKHTGATAAVDAGIPERHIMDQLRHKSFETTDHYFRRHRGFKSQKIKLDWPEI